MTENKRFQDEFVSLNAVNDYYKTKMSCLDKIEVKLIIDVLKDSGKLKGSEKLGTLLDVGCGYGVTTSLMAKHFENAIGMDSSESQIRKANSITHPDNVHFKTASAETLPVADHSVDVIIAIFAVQNFEIDQFVAECRRVLKPQGVAIFYSDYLSKLTSVGNDDLPAIVDEITSTKEDCYAIAQEMSHPVRHIQDHSQALYDSIDWNGKSKIRRTVEVDCRLLEVRDYYLGIPFYAKLGVTTANPMVKLFQDVQKIWGVDGENGKDMRVNASFLASMVILE